MFIEDIVEDEVEIWTEGIISCLSINRGYFQGNRVQVVDDDFFLASAYCQGGGGGIKRGSI